MVSKTENENKNTSKWFFSKLPENRRFKFFNWLSNSNEKLKENSIIQENLRQSNEDARNLFSENIKEEMNQSLAKMQDVNLITVEIDRNLKHDEFWNFINIKINENDRMKCRQYQPGITWLAYKHIKNDQYSVWFYEKGEPIAVLPFKGEIKSA